MPDISAARCGSVFLVVSRDLDPVQNPLGGGYLIRAHDHQHFLTGKNAVPRQYVEKGMLGEKRLCKVDKVGDNAVVRVSPERGEFKAVGGLCILLCRGCFVHGIMARGVGIIFCIRAVGDDKNLNILKQTAAGKEAVALIAVYLIERLADRNSAPFQLDMNHRQTVDEHRHVIAVIVLGALALADLILVDDLHKIVVDVLFVDQSNVFARAVVAAQHLHKVLLQLLRFFGNALVLIGDAVGEKALPFAVREGAAVELLELRAQVLHQSILVTDMQIFIPLCLEHTDKFRLQLRLGLIAFGVFLDRGVFGDDGAVGAFCNDIEIRHGYGSSASRIRVSCSRNSGKSIVTVL